MRDLFGEYYVPTEADFADMWQKGIFTFDANVLLNFYRYTAKTRDNLLDIIEKLQPRIWLPHQAALEFSKNRISVILEQNDIFNIIEVFETQVQQKITKEILQKHAKRGHFFADLDKIQAIFEQTKQSLKEELESGRGRHPDPMNQDIILERLEKLFKGRIGDPYAEDKMTQLSATFESRYKQGIPPGYKDAKKQSDPNNTSANPANKYGDVLIWFQLLDYAKQEQHPIILVEDDVKEDWWSRVHGRTIGARGELRREMRENAGVSFYMYISDNFIQKAQEFLRIEVSKETIDEVRDNRVKVQDRFAFWTQQPNHVSPSPNLFSDPHLFPSHDMKRELAQQARSMQRISNMLGFRDISEMSRFMQQQNRLLQYVKLAQPYVAQLDRSRDDSDDQHLDDDGLDQDDQTAGDPELPTGYATSERRGGERPEKLAKTTEMCLAERKRVEKGGEEDDRSCRPHPGGPDGLAEHAVLVWGSRRYGAHAPAARNPQRHRGAGTICASSDGQV